MRKWTERERKIQAWRCRKSRPWKKSTGPRSEEGKNLARDNAFKHGLRSENGIELSRLLAAQKQFVRIALLQNGAKDVVPPE